jgi:hypothetical protein
MPDIRPADLRPVIADLEGAIARAELQVVLLCSVLTMREEAGRDATRLERLVRDTGRRVADLHAERGRLLAERDRRRRGPVETGGERPG